MRLVKDLSFIAVVYRASAGCGLWHGLPVGQDGVFLRIPPRAGAWCDAVRRSNSATGEMRKENSGAEAGAMSRHENG